MLEIRNLKKSYDRVIFENVSLSFPSRGFFFITGENGSGKSTLMNIILGIEEADEGQILFNHKVIEKKDAFSFRAKYLTCIFQDYGLIDHFSLEQNLRLPLLNVNKKITKEDLLNYLKRVNLNKNLHTLCKNLSGGEKQRLAIARSLMLDKEIYLCDEPTGSLDEENTQEIFNILKKISQEKLVICICHDEKSVSKYADYIYSLNEKKLYSFKKNSEKPFKENTIQNKRISLLDKLTTSYYSLTHRKTRTLICLLTSVMIFLTCILSFSLTYSIENNIDESFQNHVLYNFFQIGISKNVSSSKNGLTFKKSYRPNKKVLLNNLNEYNYVFDYNYDYFFKGCRVIKNRENINVDFKPLDIDNLDFSQVFVNQACYELIDNSCKLIIDKTIRTEDQSNNVAHDNINLEIDLSVLQVVEEFSYLSTPTIYYSNRALKAYLQKIELKNYSRLKEKRVSLLERFSLLSTDQEELSSFKYNIWLKEENIPKVYQDLINKGYEVYSIPLEKKESLKELLNIILVSLNTFLVISIIITFLLMGVIFYSLIVDRKKEIALLSIYGINNKEIKGLLSFDSVFINSIAFIYTLILLKPLQNVINKVIFHYLKLKDFLTIPKKIYFFNYDFYVLFFIISILLGLSFSYLPTKLYLGKKIVGLTRDE